MNKIEVVVLIIVLLTSLTACTTTKDSPRAITAGELSIEEGYPLILKLTPYESKGTKSFLKMTKMLRQDMARPLSEEEMMAVGGANLPPVPMSEVEFREYVERYTTVFQGENVNYSRSGGESIYAVTATVVQAKFGLGRLDGVVRIEDNVFVQIIRDGKPCGVWNVEPK